MKSMKQWAGAVALAALAIVAFGRPAVAQVTETGTIEVIVQDQGGLAIPGATVVARPRTASPSVKR